MRIGLFIPCYIEHLRPQAGLATARLLDKLGLDWRYPSRQSCCGQPAYNAGYPGESLAAARCFLRAFEPFDAVVAPSGSCIGMIRRYSSLPGFSAAECESAGALAERSFELSEFLVRRLGIIDVGARFAARAAFQDCCHSLRELGLVEEPRRLLRAVRDLDLVDQPELECCGFGGVYAMKLPELSRVQADERLDALSRARTSTLIVTDVSCLIHLEARAAKRGLPFRGLHLAEVLAPPDEEALAGIVVIEGKGAIAPAAGGAAPGARP